MRARAQWAAPPPPEAPPPEPLARPAGPAHPSKPGSAGREAALPPPSAVQRRPISPSAPASAAPRRARGRAESARCGRREQRLSRGRRRGTCRCAGSCCRPRRPWPRSRRRPRPRGRRSPQQPARPSTAFRSRCCGGSAGAWTERPRAGDGGGWPRWRGVGDASGSGAAPGPGVGWGVRAGRGHVGANLGGGRAGRVKWAREREGGRGDG